MAGYGAAKAAVVNFTRYMCGELATKFGAGLRVNAIAPGFFLTEQNRTLLTNPDGSLTPRARTILAHTPFGRFGEPGELLGTPSPGNCSARCNGLRATRRVSFRER